MATTTDARTKSAALGPAFGMLWVLVGVLAVPFGIYLGTTVIPPAMILLVGVVLGGAAGLDAEAMVLGAYVLSALTGVGLVIGLGQWLLLRSRTSRAGWWIVAAAIAHPLGGIAGIYAAQTLAAGAFLPKPIPDILGFATAGAVVGLLQWPVLSRWVPRAWWWVIGTAGGYGVGYAAGLAVRALIPPPSFDGSIASLFEGMLTFFLGLPGYLALTGTSGLITAGILIQLWQAPVWRALRLPLLAATAALVGAAGFSAIRAGPGAERALNVQAPEPAVVLRGHDTQVLDVAWSPDGTRVAAADAEARVLVWDAATGRMQAEAAGTGGSVSWHPGPRLVTGSAIWSPDLTQRVPIPEVWMRGRGVWSPDGKILAVTGFADFSVRLFDGGTGAQIGALHGPRGWISSAAWAPDSTQFAAVEDGRAIHVWDSGEKILAVTDHPDVAQIAWSPDGTRLAAAPIGAGESRVEIRIWNARTGGEERRLPLPLGIPRPAPVWSHDGRYLAAPGAEGVYIWDTSTWDQVAILRHPITVEWLAWSPTSPLLAVIVADTVRIWGAIERREVYVLRGHAADVLTIAWSRDGTRLAAGGSDQTVRIWNLR